jgi:hypothetical protein
MKKLQGNPLCSYLKQTKMSFFPPCLLQNWRRKGQNRSCLGGLVPVRRVEEVGGRVWEGDYRNDGGGELNYGIVDTL